MSADSNESDPDSSEAGRSATPVIGYCTNVHAGMSLKEIRGNLDTYACDVHRRLGTTDTLPIGLWLPAEAARDLQDANERSAFCDWLRDRHLHVFTINGFPYGHFHRGRVKHDVYRPHWADPRRLEYTLHLAAILADLHEAGAEVGISTLPIGWPADLGDGDMERAADNLLHAVDRLSRLAERTGVVVHIDLEPEPGCVLDRSSDVVAFFDQRLFKAAVDRERVARHLRVCHDVCHAAVMFEDQHDVMNRYREAGVRVGKVQLSSAIRVDLRQRSDVERTEAVASLKPFSEDRYLHQTVVESDGSHVFHEDLPLALEAFGRTDRAGDEWRVHYHLPLFLDRVGPLRTTQGDVLACLDAIGPGDGVSAFEVETYTWSVLPGSMRDVGLAEGIARELDWAASRVAERLRQPGGR